MRSSRASNTLEACVQQPEISSWTERAVIVSSLHRRRIGRSAQLGDRPGGKSAVRRCWQNFLPHSREYEAGWVLELANGGEAPGVESR